MTRYITLLVVFFLALSESFACEVCGCSASSAGLGLVSGFRNHTLGLRWSEASFEGAGEGQDVGAQDAFHTYELFARYHLSSRWLLAAGLPYRRNVRQASDGDRLSQDGFSDPRLLVGYVLLDQQQLGKSGKLYLEVQAGAKFPLGRYNSDIHQENLPENFNTGYGCFAYLAQANAVLLMGKAGLSWSASAQFNGRSTDDYRFGRQLTSSLLGFYQLQPAFGVLFFLAGLWAMFNPGATTAALADSLGLLFLLVGIFWVIEAFSTKAQNELWWLGLLSGIIMFVLAFWVAGQFFFERVYILLVFAGIWAMLQGVTDVIRAFQLKRLGRLITS